jgi:Spy/CpxP family protein refolding chaperone
MRFVPKMLLALLTLAAISPLAIAQGQPPERQGPPEDPRWGEEIGPPVGHPADFRWGGEMGPDGRRRGHSHFMLGELVSNPEFRERLGITAEQATKIRQEELNFRKALIRNRADLEVKRLELAELLAADKPDRAAIDKSLHAISESRFAAEKSAIDHHLAMREALTAEQREKMHQMLGELHGRGGEHSHRHFGPGGEPPRSPSEPKSAPPLPKPEGPSQPEN